jgi:23S rRNA (cytosine1962-C5)-methyltransferase
MTANTIECFFPPKWSDYALTDSGNFEKLERFGQYFLIRPEPQAVWQPTLPPREWERRANVRFEQKGSHSGVWRTLQPMPERWEINYERPDYKLQLRLALTTFKHIGVFPEQAVNWDYTFHHCRRIKDAKVLNLFAYTGAASLAARAAGANITHVDAVRQIIQWGKENMFLSKLDDVRWIVDDALKFVKRENRRGQRYHGIILDPPAFGHGPGGERWHLDEHIDLLLRELLPLLNPEKNFFVFNCYSMGFSPVILRSLVMSYVKAQALKNMELGELCLFESEGKRWLPTGVFLRFWN